MGLMGLLLNDGRKSNRAQMMFRVQSSRLANLGPGNPKPETYLVEHHVLKVTDGPGQSEPSLDGSPSANVLTSSS